MEKKKLILSQSGNKFYLSVPEEIYIGKFKIGENILDKDEIIVNFRYNYFFRDEDINYTRNYHNIGYSNFDNSINIIFLEDNLLIIPEDIFELNKNIFDRLKNCLKRYENIFDIEFREFYSNNNDDFKNYKVNINYEMIKLENPIKNKNYLFRLKDNNIPISWVEQSDYLIKKLENLNARYGNISCEKVNLVYFNGKIPKNIDFIINEEYAKRLDELFKSWNNGNKKSKRMELIEYLFKTYNDIKSCKNNYFIKVNDKITVLVDVEKLEILEFKSLFYNNDMKSYSKLVECVNNIQKEIDKINEKNVDN